MNDQLSTRDPAKLRDQAALLVKMLRYQKSVTYPIATKEQWKQLHKTLNAEETLKVISKPAIDQNDKDMREGLAYLELMAMDKNPGALNGTWSPLLLKVASC